MDLIRFSIEKPVTVIVGIILVVLFGMVGLKSMPYQLSPSVVEPEITVTTTWLGATPYEIERDIIEEQENVLKGIPNLVEMESTSSDSRGEVTLRFAIGTDVNDALLRVSNKLNEVPSYPVNVDKPVINATGAATSPIIWMILKADEDNPNPIGTYRTFFENDVRQHLERVEGVADLFIGGGEESEMHVTVDPAKLAAYNLTVNDVIAVLRSDNANVSAGTMGVGRREYRIRTVGEYESPEEIDEVIIKSTGQRRVRVGDVAKASFGHQKKTVAMMHNGVNGIAIGIKPEPGSNVLELTDRTQEAVDWLNAGILKPKKVHLDWVYDQRPYINGAIGLVKQNILIGGVLAVIVLLLFLRSVSSTIVAGSAIPISIIGTFIFMKAMDRNLNVVSLAGIAFAVGMLVDNAIVVLENIDRHRMMGKNAFDAAYDGSKEVWGAVLASTLTTVAVFLPVVFMEEEAGQLFRDIAIAVTGAVTLSLFVSVSVIPMFTKQLYALRKGKKEKIKAKFIADIGGSIVNILMWLVGMAIKNWKTRLFTVLSLTGLSIIAVAALTPQMEYLPQGNRNLVINIIVPPPGLSYDEMNEIGQYIFDSAAPYIGVEEYEGVPGIKNMFYVGSDRFMLFGAISSQESRASELVPMFNKIIYSIPGMFGVSMQAGIFQTRLGRGRTIDVDVSGDDMNNIVQSTGALFGTVMNDIPDAQLRPVPSLELTYPEIRFEPRRDRLKAAGLSAEDLGVLLDVIMDGRKIDEFKQTGKKKIDLVLNAVSQDASTPEKLYDALVVTPGGKVVPVSSLAELVRTSGITQIRHLERNRTITLQVTPPPEMPIEAAMDVIGKDIDGLKAGGVLQGVNVRMSGAADKLETTRNAVQWNFLLAALIAYLLMAALFGNFIYPLIIMFTVPLAFAGGILGLNAVNLLSAVERKLGLTALAQTPLDILTMLGFVILIGVVVNNAILIVHQSLNNIRFHNMEYKEAVLESTRSRLRPIYMSASTSIFGMLPLVVWPGPGSELYRGIGSVVLGGLAMSTIFTVFVIPSLLMFVIKMEKRNEN